VSAFSEYSDPEILRLPYAADGSCFHPGLATHSAMASFGALGVIKTRSRSGLARFLEASEYLRSIGDSKMAFKA